MDDSNEKKTQGHHKMLLYLEELIRNKDFRRLAKRVKSSSKKHNSPEGSYYNWHIEAQEKHDSINNELISIIKGYELLRKRCNRVLRTKYVIAKNKMASDYGLDNELINLTIAMIGKNDKEIKFTKGFSEQDMCQIVDLYDEMMCPINKADEIIHLSIVRQLLITAYPLAIVIHPRASKRDILDYIEKRWKWIDAVKSTYENDRGVLKIRKRKHSTAIVDFIWENRGLSAKQLKVKLDSKFPKNNLLYYEIGKIIQLEKERRFRNLT